MDAVGAGWGGGGGRSLSHTAPPCVPLARCRPGIGLTQDMITIIMIMIMISLHRAGRCAKRLLTAPLRPAHPSPVPVPHVQPRIAASATVLHYRKKIRHRRRPPARGFVPPDAGRDRRTLCRRGNLLPAPSPAPPTAHASVGAFLLFLALIIMF